MIWRGLALAVILTFSLTGPGYGESPVAGPQGGKMTEAKAFQMQPIGQVKKQGEQTFLEIKPEFAPALKGLEDFSHLWVLYWFHENDRPEARATLQVHPRRDPANPLTGVFACRAPERPNLIGLVRLPHPQDQGQYGGSGGPGRPGRHPHRRPEALYSQGGRDSGGDHAGVGEAAAAAGMTGDR